MSQGKADPVPEHLVDAAVECLATYGPRKTAVTDVAEHAGVSRATAYRAFGSKRQMLQLVVRREYERLFAACAPRFAGDGPLEERLADTLELSLEWLREHPVVRHMLHHDPELLAGLMVERPGETSYLQLASEGIAQALAADPGTAGFRATPREAAEWIVRAGFGLLLSPTSAFADTRQMAAIMIRGL
jgi:AcrR family transcriptional regulator